MGHKLSWSVVLRLGAFLATVVVGVLGDGTGRVNTSYFISWEDLSVGQRRAGLQSKDDLGFNWTNGRIIVVDSSGRGDSVTVQGAVDMVPQNNTERVKILILRGIYREKVYVPKSKPHISFIGDENRPSETVITWNNKASDKDSRGNELGTYRSASVTVESDYFCATGITFENTVVAEPGGYGMQAVAFRLSGDKSMLYKIRVLGTQDTLLDESGSHYFYRSYIRGSVDFIFGRSKSLYEECELHSTATGSGAIAAHHRDTPNEDTGFSFVNCTINGTGSIYLGRAWGDYSTVVYSYCNFDSIIAPVGWSDWNRPNRQKTVVFGEFQCQGAGADTRGRVPWSKHMNYDQARPFLDRKFIHGNDWLRL